MSGLAVNVYRKIFAGWLLILLLAPVAWAQKTNLNGSVSDARSALPVGGVSVQVKGSGQKTITDANGTFSIQNGIVSATQTLIFSHVGFETLELELRPGQKEVSVRLTPATKTLSEVKITASGKLKPAKVRPETVLDFAITKDRLFVLGWENGQKNPTLQVLNLYNDSLLLNCRLPVYAEKLFVDCLENLHLLTEKRVYQVYSDSVSLSLYQPEPKAVFEQQLLPCLVTDEKHAYFRQNFHKGIIVSFLAVNRQTHKKNVFRTVMDEAVLTMQKSEARYQFFRSGGGDSEMNMNRTSHGAANNVEFAQKVMFEAPYIPLLKIGAQVCLFDHVNGEIEFYSEGSLNRVLPVNYHLKTGWEKQILVDAPQEKAFVTFSINGLYELRTLDLQSGKLENTFRIPNPFAEKITVHNGLVYFLYKDPAKHNRQFLYKAPLKALQN